MILKLFTILVPLSNTVARGEELKSGMFSKTVTKTDQMYLWTCTFEDTSVKV